MIKTCQYLSGASTLILSEVRQKLISIAVWDGEHLTGSSLVTSGTAFWLISDTYCQSHLDDLPSQQQPPCLGEHQTSIITRCRTVGLSDFVRIRFWQKTSEVSGSLSVAWFPKLVTATPLRMPPPSSILQCTHAMQQQNSSVRQNADTALRWPAKRRVITLSHDTWDQQWQLQIWSCSTFHPLTDAVDNRQQIVLITVSALCF